MRLSTPRVDSLPRNYNFNNTELAISPSNMSEIDIKDRAGSTMSAMQKFRAGSTNIFAQVRDKLAKTKSNAERILVSKKSKVTYFKPGSFSEFVL
jgi:uncharacterized protein (DUF3084 family)